MFRNARRRWRHLRLEVVGALVVSTVTILAMLIATDNRWTFDQVVGTFLILAVVGTWLQAYVEFRLYFTMRHRRDRSQVGIGLKAKWWSLGWKMLLLGLRDLLLFYIVVAEPHISPVLIVAMVASTTAATVMAAGIGQWLLSRLRNEEEKLPPLGRRHA